MKPGAMPSLCEAKYKEMVAKSSDQEALYRKVRVETERASR